MLHIMTFLVNLNLDREKMHSLPHPVLEEQTHKVHQGISHNTVFISLIAFEN